MQKAFERSELLGIKVTAPMIVRLSADAVREGAESGVLGTNGSGTSKRRWLSLRGARTCWRSTFVILMKGVER